MARRHRMTPARRAALRKAQLASAAKRRRKSQYKAAKKQYNKNPKVRRAKKYIAVGGAVGTLTAGPGLGTGLGVAAGIALHNHRYGNNLPKHPRVDYKKSKKAAKKHKRRR